MQYAVFWSCLIALFYCVFGQLCPAIVTFPHHGHSDSTKSCSPCQGQRQVCLETPQAGCHSFDFYAIGKDQDQITEASLQGSNIFASHYSRHGRGENRTMEVPSLQKGLFRVPSILWKMWSILESMCRPQFCSSKEGTKIGSMDLQQHRLTVGRWNLDRCTVGSISKTSSVPTPKVSQKIQRRSHGQGQRSCQGLRRQAQFWATCLTIYECTAALDGFDYSTTVDFTLFPIDGTAGNTRGSRERQANAHLSRCAAPPQRRVAPGCPNGYEGH